MKPRVQLKTTCLKHAVVAMIAAGLLAGCGPKPDPMQSAKEALGKNDRTAALIHLRNALQQDPNLAEARFLLGKAQLETGQVAGAQKDLRLALELNYSPDEVIPPLAEAMLLSGEYKNVVDEFGQIEAKTPEVAADLPAPLAAAMQQLGVAATNGRDKSKTVVLTTPQARGALQTTVGQAYLALGNVKGAKAAFAAAIATTPDYAPAILGTAQLQAAANDISGASAAIDAALIKNPKFAEGWAFKGDLAAAHGELDGALVAYRKAAELKPDFLAVHSKLVTLLAGQGKADEASAQLEALKKMAPGHPQTLYLQALLAYQRKDFAAARDDLQRQLRAAPDDLQGLLLSGAVDYELGSYASAESHLAKFLNGVPKHMYARRLLVATHLRNGQSAKALEVLKPVLGMAGQDAPLLALAGAVFLVNGQLEEASKYFTRTVALDPKSSSGRLGLALSHLAAGNTNTAFGELERAAAESPGTMGDWLLIRSALARDEYDKALVAIDALDKKRPNTPLVSYLRGVVQLGKHDAAGAGKQFQAALAIDPAFFPAVASLARLDLANQQPEEAKKRFDAVLARDPKNVSALLAVAELRALNGGSPDEVASLIEKAIAADPNAVLPRLTLMGHWLRAKEVKKAVDAGQNALAALPDRREILQALGRAQFAAGDINQALATYNKLVQLDPNSPVPLLFVADAQLAGKQNEAALLTLRKALALQPDMIDAQRRVVMLEFDAGRMSRAVAMAREVQKQRPKEAIGYILEGDSFAYNKSFDEAVAAYRRGLKQAGTADLAMKLHAVLNAKGNAKEAEQFATLWTKEHPTDAKFRGYLAEYAMARSDYPAAAREYRLLLDLQPNNAGVLNNLAWASGQLQDPKAIEYAEKAKELASNQPEILPAILDTLGTLLVEKGDVGRGIEVLQEASKLAPAAPLIRLNLARALIKAGQKDAAKKELEEVAKMGGKFKSQADVEQLMKGLGT